MVLQRFGLREHDESYVDPERQLFKGLSVLIALFVATTLVTVSISFGTIVQKSLADNPFVYVATFLGLLGLMLSFASLYFFSISARLRHQAARQQQHVQHVIDRSERNEQAKFERRTHDLERLLEIADIVNDRIKARRYGP